MDTNKELDYPAKKFKHFMWHRFWRAPLSTLSRSKCFQIHLFWSAFSKLSLGRFWKSFMQFSQKTTKCCWLAISSPSIGSLELKRLIRKCSKRWACAKDHFWPAARKFPAQKTVTYCLVSKFITLRSVRWQLRSETLETNKQKFDWPRRWTG